MLKRGDDVAFALERSVALESFDRSGAQFAIEERILPICFLDAPPPCIARDIHDGRQSLGRPANPGLVGGHPIELLDQSGVERCPQPDRLRKACAVPRSVTVQTFLVKNHRDTQPAFLEEKLLNGVGQLGHSPSGLASPGFGWWAAGIT